MLTFALALVPPNTENLGLASAELSAARIVNNRSEHCLLLVNPDHSLATAYHEKVFLPLYSRSMARLIAVRRAMARLYPRHRHWIIPVTGPIVPAIALERKDVLDGGHVVTANTSYISDFLKAIGSDIEAELLDPSMTLTELQNDKGHVIFPTQVQRTLKLSSSLRLEDHFFSLRDWSEPRYLDFDRAEEITAPESAPLINQM